MQSKRALMPSSILRKVMKNRCAITLLDLLNKAIAHSVSITSYNCTET